MRFAKMLLVSLAAIGAVAALGGTASADVGPFPRCVRDEAGERMNATGQFTEGSSPILCIEGYVLVYAPH
jgi:hypothetical protein